MKIKIQKTDLLILLQKTQNIVERKNTMPMLLYVLLEAREQSLVVFATNLVVSLTDKVSATVLSEGKIAVNAKNLFELLKELPDGEVNLSTNENYWLTLEQNSSKFNFVGIDPERYPEFPTLSTNTFIKVKTNILKEMIEKTIYSISNDETRHYLNGVYFEKASGKNASTYKMISTDSHRLSLVERSVLNEDKTFLHQKGIIIPRKGLYEIKKIIDLIDEDLEIAIDKAQVVIKNKEMLLMIRLIEGKYPNYNQFIPKDFSKKILLNKNTFLQILKRVSLLSDQKSKGITLKIEKNKIEITSNDKTLGNAKEEMTMIYDGPETKMSFNARFILDFLSSLKDNQENIEFNFNDSLSPGVLRPEKDDKYTCLVMPMRI